MADDRTDWPAIVDLHERWPTDQQWRECIAILSACVEANKASDRALGALRLGGVVAPLSDGIGGALAVFRGAIAALESAQLLLRHEGAQAGRPG
jgi:hypothetical protein